MGPWRVRRRVRRRGPPASWTQALTQATQVAATETTVTRVLKTDARIAAATNRDLAQAITKGQFREDLFYRLNVFAIQLPPLRDRRDDVLPLSEAFLAEYGRTLLPSTRRDFTRRAQAPYGIRLAR